MWTDFFDKILLINLEKRSDRLLTASLELYKHQIPFERVEAIEDENGAYGLFKTLLGIFERADKENWENILIFEDDCIFIQENGMDLLADRITFLKLLDWDLFYLGGNVFKSLQKVPILMNGQLLCSDGILSTHALAYSKQGWKLVLQEMRRATSAGITTPEPYDLLLHRIIQPRGKTFITAPILCTQKAGWSDVENRNTDYKNYLEDRFNERFKQLVW